MHIKQHIKKINSSTQYCKVKELILLIRTVNFTAHFTVVARREVRTTGFSPLFPLGFLLWQNCCFSSVANPSLDLFFHSSIHCVEKLVKGLQQDPIPSYVSIEFGQGTTALCKMMVRPLSDASMTVTESYLPNRPNLRQFGGVHVQDSVRRKH